MASNPSENFVAIPKNAATIIQNNAPGPPAHTAVATPTMFPVPIVALSAVHKAAKLDISPLPPSSFLIIHLSASGSLRICRTPRRTVSKIPPQRINTISGTPQTKLSTVFKNALIVVHIIFLLIFLFQKAFPAYKCALYAHIKNYTQNRKQVQEKNHFCR